MTSKSNLRSLCLALTLASGAGSAPTPLFAAEDVDALQRQNAELRQRLERVEQDLAAIKKLLAPGGAMTAGVSPAAPAEPSRPVAAAAFTEAETTKLKSLAALKGHPARSSLDLNFYGYVKLDAAFDDSRTSLGNFARWSESESVLKNDHHFYLTANQTRLGVDATGPATENFQSTGKVEIDFYGAGTGENKPEPMLRHAFVRVDWPRRKLALIAGQTSDIISPLNPTTVNYSVAWWQGNVGYRRPQLRLVKSIDVSEGVELKLDGGFSRTITGRKAFFKDANDPDTGADAGYPTLAGRAGLSFPVAPKRIATIGISGHIGAEEIHRNDLIGTDNYQTHSINADVRLPLSASVLLQAEFFFGRNFDSHLGGIGQGVNLTLNREIDAVGGWAALTLSPSPQWQWNFGASLDDPDDDALTGNADPARDARAKNTLFFGNVHYSLSPQLQLAFEIARLRTLFKTNAPGTDWRQQFAIIYKF